jgi:hypothetical protein
MDSMREFLTSRRPTPAMAVAFIALLAALSGTAVALPGTSSVDSGDIKNKQVKGKDLANNAVTGKKVKNSALTGADIKDDSLTGSDVNESTLGQVPSANTANSATNATNATNATSAGNADNLDGQDSTAYVQKTELLYALVNNAGTLLDGRGATAATRLGAGSFRVTFNRAVNSCVSTASMTDATGGAVPNAAFNRMVSTDNRVQGDNTTIDIATTNAAAADEDPAGGDGFVVTVFC